MVRQNRVEIRHVCIGATEEGDHRFSVLMVLLCLRTSTVQTGLTRSILLYIRPSIYPSIHLCFYVSIHFSFCLSIYLYIPPPYIGLTLWLREGRVFLLSLGSNPGCREGDHRCGLTPLPRTLRNSDTHSLLRDCDGHLLSQNSPFK